MKIILLFLNLFVALGSHTLAAEEAMITVKNSWARESPPTVTNGAVYMTLINHGNEADYLIGASGDVAATIELHHHVLENNMMKMRQTDSVEISPNKPTVLKPGALHIMLIGLQQPLAAGQTFPLTLQFEKTSNITVDVTVCKLGEGTMQRQDQ
jgi:copper(I)-binding protein